MGRSASVDPLGLHNLKLGTDSVVITYDDSKMDSTGERLPPKNCYANPYCPSISTFLALGVWIMLSPEQYESSDSLFLKEGTIIGTATKRFAAHLRNLVADHRFEVATWAVPDRIKAHSGRKGTATFLTAATLNPPPLPSIAHRGEWSQGKVQDIYFNFAQPGDHYIGRMLAGLDPTNPSFQVLPPHFTCGLENEYVKEGVELCYGRIMKARHNLDYLPGVFLLVLASIVYHEEWIRGYVQNNKKHTFSNLFLLENAYLMRKLRELVTTEPTTNMPRPTGIPTHINLQTTMEKILLNNNEFLNKLELQSTIIQDAVKKAIQDNDIASGNVTMPILTEQLANHHQSIIEFIKTNCANVSATDCRLNNNDNNNNAEAGELLYVKEFQKGSENNPLFCYSSHFWDVPKGFIFQKNPTRKIGWEFGLKGKPNNEVLVDGIIRKAPVKPYRKLNSKLRPSCSKQANVLTSTWSPIFTTMERTPDLNIPNNLEEITAKVIDDTFDKATKYLKEKVVSYIWNMPRKDIANWSISTWSKHVSNGFIRDNGTDSDKDNLIETFRCLPRKRNRSAEALLPDSPNHHVDINNNGNNNNNNGNNNQDIVINNNGNNNRRTAAIGPPAIRRRTNNGHTVENNNTNNNDMFGELFEPDPLFLEMAVQTNENESDDTTNNTTNEIAHLTERTGTDTNNTMNTTATFSAAVSTILETAAELDSSDSDNDH